MVGWHRHGGWFGTSVVFDNRLARSVETTAVSLARRHLRFPRSTSRTGLCRRYAHPTHFRERPTCAHRIFRCGTHRRATRSSNGIEPVGLFFLNGIFQIIRPIAPIAWIPLTILWFGLGTSAKIFVIWLAAFAPVVINTQTGVRNVEPVLIAAARAHGASRWRILIDVVIPGALPTIFTGLRISLQACWMVLVAAELVGSFAGLGHIMIIATRDLNPGMIVVAMASVAVLGVLFTAILSLVEREVTPWR